MPEAAPALGASERRLLLNCARVEMDDRTAAETDGLLRSPLAWEPLLFHARLHSIAPLMHRHVSRSPAAEGVPPAARRRLLELSHATAYRNRLFADENRGLMEAFDRAGIPFIVPKGLATIELAYGGRLELRPLIDLIFFVRREDVGPTRELFLARGYRHKRWRPFDALYRWSCPQLLFQTFRRLKIQVLVFWDVVTWPRVHRFLPQPLWERAGRVAITGRPALVLSPEDWLLYLCLQPDHHGYLNRVAAQTMAPADLLFAEWSHNRLVRFADIAQMLERRGSSLDWDTVVERARESGIEEAVCTSLRLTEGLLGPVTPPGVLDRLPTRGRHRIRRWLFEAVSGERSARAGVLQRVAGSRWRQLRPYRQLRLARLIGLAEVLFPERHLLRVKYGRRSRMWEPGVYALHAATGVARSTATFVAVSLIRAVAGPTRPRGG